MTTTHKLKVGETLAISGEVTVVKCGLHSECGGEAVPTVTLAITQPDPAQPPADEQVNEPVAEEPAHEIDE